MDDIGSTDDTALLCHTNEPSPSVILEETGLLQME